MCGSVNLLRLLCGLVIVSCGLPAESAGAESVASVDDRLKLDDNDWPWWRGPFRNGEAPSGQTPPQSWSQDENVIWRADVPGRGHGSPIVVGDAVYLQIADAQRDVQAVAAYSRQDGGLLWETIVHRGGLTVKNSKSTAASSTPACAGERLFVNFLNGNAVYTTALDRHGKQLWQTKISDYQIHQGYGSSPALYQSLVIAAADNKAGGAIVALHQQTGEVQWQRARPEKPNYPSPVLLRIGQRDQLLMTGCDLVTSLNPLTGATLWEVPGATTECVTSTVTDGQLIFTSGGYPRNHMSAVRADGTGEIVWENANRIYVPSMLVRDGYLYGIMDAGVAVCWQSATGKQQWRSRLEGTFTASPVLVNDLIYATNESGTTFVFRASPERFEQVAENQLGDEVLATPAICGSRIYMRVAENIDGQRQERLYCLGVRL
jgi:hypothetical protein